MTQDEILVVLDEHTTDHEPPAGAAVIHRASHRVFTVHGDDTVLAQMRQDNSYAYVGRRPPAGVVQALHPDERLFVDAWLVRTSGKPLRAGEGLSWDAEGMTPPDPPPPHQGRR